MDERTVSRAPSRRRTGRQPEDHGGKEQWWSGLSLVKPFHQGERLLYTAVAVALALGGASLFVYVVGRFFSRLGDAPFIGSVLDFLDGLLLVFIVTELLHTVRAVIAENVLLTEPFLIVGIVAAIRRLIVISAEAPDVLSGSDFNRGMTEMVVLIGGILVLGFTIFLLRHTDKPEPRPRDAFQEGLAARRTAAGGDGH